MVENKDIALEIVNIATLLIEQESEPSSALLETNLNIEFYQGKYLIKLQAIPNYLVIKAEETDFLIEMLDGNLMIALGIENEDINYWRKLELAMYR